MVIDGEVRLLGGKFMPPTQLQTTLLSQYSGLSLIQAPLQKISALKKHKPKGAKCGLGMGN